MSENNSAEQPASPAGQVRRAVPTPPNRTSSTGLIIVLVVIIIVLASALVASVV